MDRLENHFGNYHSGCFLFVQRSPLVDCWGVIVSSVGAWLVGLGIPWPIWICLSLLPFCLLMAIRQTWFPHRFFNKKRLRSVESGKSPHVVPVKSGWDGRSYSGLFFKNNGDVPAYSIVVEPLQLGETTVEFTGPEATYLESGDDFFLRLANFPPSILMKNRPRGNSLFELLRSWHMSMLDEGVGLEQQVNKLGAQAKGCIRYKDGDGLEYETRYRIRRDVLNRETGLAIEIELD